MTAYAAPVDEVIKAPVRQPEWRSLTPRGFGLDSALLDTQERESTIAFILPSITNARLPISPWAVDVSLSQQWLRAILRAYKARLRPDLYQRMLDRVAAVLDPEEWQEEDALPNPESFRRMLEFLCRIPDLRIPSVSVNRYGLFNASWRPSRQQLVSLVFQPADDVTWLLFLPREGTAEDTVEVAGRCPTSEAMREIAMHDSLSWMMRG